MNNKKFRERLIAYLENLQEESDRGIQHDDDNEFLEQLEKDIETLRNL